MTVTYRVAFTDGAQETVKVDPTKAQSEDHLAEMVAAAASRPDDVDDFWISTTKPTVGERWRWSECPDQKCWCGGNDGVIVEVFDDHARVRLDGKSSIPRNTYDGEVGFDAFPFEALKSERISS